MFRVALFATVATQIEAIYLEELDYGIELAEINSPEGVVNSAINTNLFA